jgi:DNA-binding CsgD family transcriptional regulator
MSSGRAEAKGATPEPPAIADDESVERVLAAVLSGRGAVVSGPPAAGVSAVLRSFLAEARTLDLPVTTTLQRQSDGEHGQVFVVDDAHRLSAATGDVLAAAVLAGSVIPVLGTTRPSATVSRLRSTGGLIDVELAALDADGIATVVSRIVDAHPDGATTRALAADSAGLRGMLVPTVRAAIADGSLSITAGIARLRGPLPLSAAVVERITSWREPLSSAGERVVQAVSVGRELPTVAAVDIFGLDALMEAEQATLVAVAEDDDIVRLSMGAVGRAVRAQLGTFGIAKIARELVDAFPDAPAARRVHWRLLAGDELDGADLVDAATAAQQRGDVSTALDLAGRAWRADELGAGLLFAEVSSTVGDRAGAALVLDELLAQAEVAAELRAAGALELATLHLWNFGQPDRAVELAAEVAALTKDTPFEAIGQGALGAMLVYTGRGADAMAVVEPYLDGDQPGQMLNCQVATTSLAVQGACERAATIGAHGLELSVAGRGDPADLDPEIHVVSYALALELGGRLDDAEHLTVDWYDRAARRSVHHAWIALTRMRIMLVRGDLASATRFGNEAAAIFGDLDNHAPRRWAVAGLVLAAAQTGDVERAAAGRAQLDLLGPSGVTFLESDVERARAWADAAEGRLDEARQSLIATAERAEERGLLAMAATAWHDVARLGRDDVAASRLLAIDERVESDLCRAHAIHAHGLVHDDADELLVAADQYVAMTAVLFGAEAAAHAVTAAERKQKKSAKRTATALLRDLRVRCPDAATPPLLDVPISSLSPRERDVVRLAAAGLTSREIGERLHLSVRTIDNLLQRSYVKLGVSGRRELPGAVDNHGG